MPTLTGTCNTFGYGATGLSGNPWPIGIIGKSISIGGSGYTVTDRLDTTHISIDPAAPIAEGVAWTVFIEDDPDPPPDPPGGHTTFVPLTLECQCDVHGRGTCGITSLEFILSGFTEDITLVIMHIGGIAVINLNGGTVISADPNAFIGIPVPLSFVVAQSMGYSGLKNCGVTLLAHAVYECLDATGGIYFIDKYGVFAGVSGEGECLSGDGHKFFHALVTGGGGSGYVVHSSPLGCTDATAGPSMGILPFEAEMIDDNSDDDPWCLCATGGTFVYNEDGTLAAAPLYNFALIGGQLPGGQRINTETGCIEGTPDPEHPGTPNVTFRVIDVASGAHADTICGLHSPPCGAVPGGAANAFL